MLNNEDELFLSILEELCKFVKKDKSNIWIVMQNPSLSPFTKNIEKDLTVYITSLVESIDELKKLDLNTVYALIKTLNGKDNLLN